MTLTHVNPTDRLAAVVTAVLALASAAGRADTPEPVAAPLEEVTVYARRLQPVTRVAATVAVITADDIERTLAADVRQMVRYEPGISVANDPFRFGLDAFTIRGISGNRVAVEVDGIPSAPGFSIGSYSNSGRAFVDLALVERVEILRGPASSLYGSDAIGGVVAMGTVTPDTLLAGQDAAVRASGGASSADDGWNATALTAWRTDVADVLLGYVHRAGHQADTAADVTPDPSTWDSDSALATARFDTAPGGPLTATIEGGRYSQQTSVEAWELLAGSRFANTVELNGDDSGSRFRASLAQRVGDTAAWDSADWDLYWQGTDTRQDTHEERRAIPPSRPGRPETPPVAIDRQFRFEERVIGGGFTAIRDFEAAGFAQEMVYGVDLSATRLVERRDGTQIDLTTGDTTSKILGETYPLRDFPNSDVVEAGLYVQDEIRGAEGRWAVIPAVRFDWYDLTPQPDRIYREDNPDTRAVGLTDLSVSPKLGITRRIGDDYTLYFQYASGFRAPPPEDVNIGLDLPLLNIRALPNPDLKPETSRGYEIGLRREQGALTYSIAGYWTDYDDFIESKVNLGADPDSGVILFQSQNVERARIYGTELAATLRAGERWESLVGWSARFALAWAKGQDLERDEPLNSVDPGSALLSLAFDAPSGRWRAEALATAVAPKREVDDSRVDLYRTDGYVTLDLLAQADLGHGFTVDVGLFNLADRAYVQWADVRGRPVGDPLIPYYTNPGRNASITLRWKR